MTPWEPRRPGEMTTIYLGRVMDDYLALPDMARRARAGHFDDYFAPAEIADGFELLRLVNELTKIARGTNRAHRLRIRDVVAAVKDGEFDGTDEEGARWVASKEGQAAINDPSLTPMVDALVALAKNSDAVAAATRRVDDLIGPDE